MDEYLNGVRYVKKYKGILDDNINRTVVLIGEHHTKEFLCPTETNSINIIDYLLELLSYANKQNIDLDFYLEQHRYIPNVTEIFDYGEYESQIHNLGEGFLVDMIIELEEKKCGQYERLIKSENNCPFGTTKIHYIDERKINSYVNKISDLRTFSIMSGLQFVSLLNFYFLSKNEYTFLSKEWYEKYIFDHLSDKTLKQWEKSSSADFNQNYIRIIQNLINSYYKHIMSPYINTTELNNYYQYEKTKTHNLYIGFYDSDYLNKMNVELEKILKKYLNIVDDLEKYLYEDLHFLTMLNNEIEMSIFKNIGVPHFLSNNFTFIHLLEELNNLFMDIYLLGRIFKPYSKNIIIYTGSAHTDLYENFLKSEGFIKTSSSVDDKNSLSCVYIGNMDYPLF